MERQRRSAFSLVELLVVIGIIGLLAAFAVPAISRSMKKGRETAAAADLQTIAVALDAYRSDFGDYPRPSYTDGQPDTVDRPNPPTGAQILCRALVGPFPAVDATAAPTEIPNRDGADGPGFRLRGTQGRTWGPYLKADSFPISSPLDGSATLLDANGKPIIYIVKARTNLLPTAANGYIATHDYTAATSTIKPLYNFFDARAQGGSVATVFVQGMEAPGSVEQLKRFRSVMGDLDNNGGINGAETAKTNAAFVLWTAGGDGQFGPAMAGTLPTKEEIDRCDDVTNFNR